MSEFVLVDALEFGIQESEREHQSLGKFSSKQELAVNDYSGPSNYASEGWISHFRCSIRWNGFRMTIPETFQNHPLYLDITLRDSQFQTDQSPQPVYIYAMNKNRAVLLGDPVVPDDDWWHQYRYELPNELIEDGGLFIAVDDQSGFTNYDSHRVRNFGQARIMAKIDSPPVTVARKQEEDAPEVLVVICPVWDPTMPPIGPAAITSFLRGNGVKVGMMDFNIDFYHQASDNWKNIWHGATAIRWNEPEFVQEVEKHFEPFVQDAADKIEAAHPSTVGFSVATVNAVLTMRLAQVVKERMPEVTIVFGGPGIPFFKPGELGEHWDYLIIGAGEYPMLHVARGRTSKVPGLISRSEMETIDTTNDRARIIDVNRMPLVDFRGFDLSKYTHPWRIPILTSRGCINQCKYCFDHVFYGPFSCLTGENAYEQCRLVLELHGRRRLEFSDLLCNGNLDHLRRMAELIIENELPVEWGSFAVIRGDMDAELMKLLAKAGCKYLHYGFESGSQKMLELMGRDYTTEIARQVLKDTHDAGIKTMINLMVGFPGETDETVEESIAFVRKHAGLIDLVDTVNPVYLMALSDIYQNRDDYKIDIHEELPDTWMTPELDMQRRERWVLKVIDGVVEAGVPCNNAISRSFICKTYE